MHPQKNPSFITCSLSLACLVTISLATNALAQKIENPSFEARPLDARSPFVTDGKAAELASPWAFGLLTGISRQGEAYAEKLEAADGSQVAFLQGDPSQIIDQPAEVPKCIIGTDITGLTVGSEYEIQWAEASRGSDLSTGALTVILSKPDGSTPAILVDRQPVQNKGGWEIQKHTFIATGETMRMNIVHTIPDLGGGASGAESTLLDDFRIRKIR